jgi:hypothetical protein
MRFASCFTGTRALAITLCWVAALVLTGSTDVLLFLAPALLIIVPLLCGVYIGEELIEKLAATRAKAPSHRSTQAIPIPPGPQTWSPRGARLVAFALAKRPPPGLLIPQT